MCGILAIVTSHELGHYFACRYHGVDATLPFFLPLPIPGGFGTFGAVIRIRSAFPHRRALFDIGIAGPLAGFVVSAARTFPGGARGSSGVPFAGRRWALHGRSASPELASSAFCWGLLTPVRWSWSVHLGMAAWFGLFLTALNLLPIGQLDGGHIVYAITPRWAALVSRFGWWVCVGLVYFGPNWIVWALLLRILGRRHPPTLDDASPLGRARLVLASCRSSRIRSVLRSRPYRLVLVRSLRRPSGAALWSPHPCAIAPQTDLLCAQECFGLRLIETRTLRLSEAPGFRQRSLESDTLHHAHGVHIDYDAGPSLCAKLLGQSLCGRGPHLVAAPLEQDLESVLSFEPRQRCQRRTENAEPTGRKLAQTTSNAGGDCGAIRRILRLENDVDQSSHRRVAHGAPELHLALRRRPRSPDRRTWSRRSGRAGGSGG